MIEEFKEHIAQKFPELLRSKFLLACSGGVDSVVLAHLCHVCSMDFALAHCNFQLRGDESNGDEGFVGDLAKKLDKDFYVTRFNTMDYVAKHKVSIQMAARTLRYAWFAEMMRENRIPILVTAHQADDTLETFLINLSRGTGIDGLTGIPERTPTMARPLLSFSRAWILEYAKRNGICWREDHSNADIKYVRNAIRHTIIPQLKELHPTFLSNFKNTLCHLGESAKIIEDHVHQITSDLFKTDGDLIKIKISHLQKLKPQKAYLYQLFKPYGFSAWNDILGLLSGMSGKEVRSKTHRLVRDREYLLLEKISLEDPGTYEIKEFQSAIEYPIHLKIETVKHIKETGKHILYVDKDTLTYPLTVRKWKKGDYLYPFGMKGKKKLSKFFKDEKIDVISKQKQWLLCSGNQIVWVIGKRPDNRFKITGKTKNCIKFTLCV